jgi:hypothetical protein
MRVPRSRHQASLASVTVALLIGLAPLKGQAVAALVTAQSPGCVAESTYTFTGQPDTFVFILPNRAWGQTVIATDSLLSGVTVWFPRMPAGGTSFELHLFVTATDSAGVPLTSNVILNGPTLPGEVSDGVNPVRCSILVDPPLRLVRNTRYFIAIQEPTCVEPLALLACTNDQDPIERSWSISGAFFCDQLGGVRPLQHPTWDMLMMVSYYGVSSTPLKHSSWGRVKQMFH